MAMIFREYNILHCSLDEYKIKKNRVDAIDEMDNDLVTSDHSIYIESASVLIG